ncbi:aldehyde dehydrogenase family protein [Nocardia nova]|uniref:aldehyde dehydrogenase family protein n=1 Tax=Nocardia nova TaxID=37330 RepID=UPI000CEA13A9|nr:aldehyde dehydrogenase family protein [Nocardia nova]PPI93215.1 aldehyde dehydrogenase [Nocardia nova]
MNDLDHSQESDVTSSDGPIPLSSPIGANELRQFREQADAVPDTVARLRAAQPAWARLEVEQRAKWVSRLRDRVLDNAGHLARTIADESGKPLAEARLEVAIAVENMSYYAARAQRFLAPAAPAPHGPLTALKRLRIDHRPYEVVGVITPWNFPLAQAVLDVIPALLAGASVVVKPSENTPMTVLELVRGWSDIGAPPVLDAVTGSGSAGEAVVAAVDYVQFTGSTRTGRAVAAQAAARLVPFGLELGGKDPAIVLPDAALSYAAKGIAWGGLANAGQMCTSIERVYVHSAVYDDFVRLLVDEVARLRMGRDYGPLTTPEQLTIVQRHVGEAVAAGARVLIGGAPEGETTGYAPTVLVDVNHDMAVMREETFGPVLPVMAFDTEDEAVALANDSTYGLSASVWTRDRRRGERIASRLRAGAVDVNDVQAHLLCFPLPMHGWGESGIGGRNGGAEGIVKYCRPQAVTSPRMTVKPLNQLLWFPYTPFKSDLIELTIRLIDGGGWRRRLGLNGKSAR